MQAGDKVTILGGSQVGTFLISDQIKGLIGQETTIIEIDDSLQWGVPHAHLKIDNGCNGYPLAWLEKL